jgi:hypothetical protein
MDESTNGRRQGERETRPEALDPGAYFSDRLARSPLRVARAEMRLEASAFVFTAERDDRSGDR